MTSFDLVEQHAAPVHRLALVTDDGSVWLTFARPWWDLASWLWYALHPGARRWMIVKDKSGRKFRVRAVRVAREHWRIGSRS